jgi:hypothetical protein
MESTLAQCGGGIKHSACDVALEWDTNAVFDA